MVCNFAYSLTNDIVKAQQQRALCYIIFKFLKEDFK